MTKDIYEMEDGFYVGHKLKNGKLGKDSYRITGEDVMTMFTKFFTDYCDDTKTDHLIMKDGRGRMFVTKLLPTEIGK